MSTRALRRLQRGRDSVLDSSSQRNNNDVDKKTAVDSDQSDDALPDSDVVGRIAPSGDKSSAPSNLFDLLNDSDDHCNGEEDEPADGDEHNEVIKTELVTVTKKKKKKKKGKNAKPCASEVESLVDDIEASIREVNEALGEVASAGVVRTDSSNDMSTLKPLLLVEHRCLNPDNEVRRLFGTRVVQAEQRKQRNRNRHRNTWLARPRDNWPVFTKTGLSMRLVESTAKNINYFAFEHNKFYQKIQFEFLDAVESLNPQNIVNLHNEHPYHIDTLLQLSEIFKMSDDRQGAAEMIERALYVFETSFHPLFSLTQGTSRLDFRITENRPFFLALWRYALSIGRKGCYRTALEYFKLMLSLDPDADPLCILLLIDFYALRSEQYSFLIRMYSEWEASRNLSQLPNFAFSVPLAMFHQATVDRTDVQPASDMLQNSLLMFPGLLIPLLDKCGIVADRVVQEHNYFGSSSQIRQSDALKQLQMLYVGRCESCWKEPPVMAWLETNVHEVIDKLNSGKITQVQLDQYASYRSSRYQGTPLNIYRHVILSEIKEATAALPPEITLSPVLSYDPLPPVDSVVSYTRPQRLRRAQQPGNPLSMFFRSLAPSFNPQDPVAPEAEVDEAAGATGGRDLRQGVAALMDVMRDLLNSIQFVPPPVVNPQGDEAADGGEGDDDEGENDADWN